MDIEHRHAHRKVVDAGLCRETWRLPGQRHIGRRSAHVERQCLFEAGEPSNLHRANDAAGRSGKNRSHRMLSRFRSRQQSSVRLHDRDVRRQFRQIPVHQRTHIRVDHRGRSPFIFPKLGRDLARSADISAQSPHQLPLMRIVAIRVQQTDRDRLHALQPFRQIADPERRFHCAIEQNPLFDSETKLTGHQRNGKGRGQVVEFGPILAPDRNQIFESLGRDKGGACTFALEQRVGGHSGAVHHASLLPADAPQPIEDHAGGRRGIRPQLEGFQFSVVIKHHKVGECAAGIDTDAHGQYNDSSPHSHDFAQCHPDSGT